MQYGSKSSELLPQCHASNFYMKIRSPYFSSKIMIVMDPCNCFLSLLLKPETIPKIASPWFCVQYYGSSRLPSSIVWHCFCMLVHSQLIVFAPFSLQLPASNFGHRVSTGYIALVHLFLIVAFPSFIKIPFPYGLSIELHCLLPWKQRYNNIHVKLHLTTHTVPHKSPSYQ